MKRLKSILPALLVALMAAVSMTSCLNDDGNDNSVTPEQEKQYRMMMSGNYRGKIFFKNEEINDNKNPNKIDTLKSQECRFNYADSTINVYSVPAKLLFKALEGHESLKAAAEAYGDVDIKLKYGIYTANGGTISYITATNPVQLTLEYDGAKHDLAIAFVSSVMGYYANNTVDFQFVEAAIYDGKDASGKWKLLENGGELYTQGMENSKLNNLIFEFYGSNK